MILSNITPRFLADTLALTQSDPICREGVVAEAGFRLLEILINAVLSPFSLSLCAAMQCSKIRFSSVYRAVLVVTGPLWSNDR